MFEADTPVEDILAGAVARMLEYFRGRSEFFALLQRYEHRLPAARRGRLASRATARRLERWSQPPSNARWRTGVLRPCDTTLCAELLLGMARTCDPVVARGHAAAGGRRPSKNRLRSFSTACAPATQTGKSAALRVARGGPVVSAIGIGWRLSGAKGVAWLLRERALPASIALDTAQALPHASRTPRGAGEIPRERPDPRAGVGDGSELSVLRVAVRLIVMF
jgi:hypothetical protein